MRLCFALTVIAACLIAASPASASHRHRRCAGNREAIRFYSSKARGWEARHDAPLTRVGNAARSPGCTYVGYAARLWRSRARDARTAYEKWFAAEAAKWECIHDHESHNWAIHNPPYDGGLQMDLGFQRTYGSEFIARWGTAGHWPVWAQYLAADRAFSGYNGYAARGYTPWPNTARACGLI